MIANAITYCRIIISMLMFLFSVFSPEFYVCYLLAGISDMIDGTIARKLGTSSKFGEKLDTVADFVFATAALFKLLPVMKISMANSITDNRFSISPKLDAFFWLIFLDGACQGDKSFLGHIIQVKGQFGKFF